MAKFGTDYQALAHHWVYNNDESECYGDRMYSKGDVIYSYGHHFPIAKKDTDVNGDEVFLITTRKHSVTTNKQKWCVISATQGMKRFFVDNVFLCEIGNVDGYISDIKELAILESKARTKDYKPEIGRLLQELKLYVSSFKIDKRRFTKSQKQVINWNLDNPIEDLIVSITGIRNEKVRLQKKKTKKLLTLRIKKAKEDLVKWLDFEVSHFHPYHLDKIYLRFNKSKNLIETSNSANISIEEGRELHNKVKRGRKILGVKLGNYSVVGVSEGSYTIGCTTLTSEVLNDMCKQLKWEEVF